MQQIKCMAEVDIGTIHVGPIFIRCDNAGESKSFLNRKMLLLILSILLPVLYKMMESLSANLKLCMKESILC
jgi:hypothetical protein